MQSTHADGATPSEFVQMISKQAEWFEKKHNGEVEYETQSIDDMGDDDSKLNDSLPTIRHHYDKISETKKANIIQYAKTSKESTKDVAKKFNIKPSTLHSWLNPKPHDPNIHHGHPFTFSKQQNDELCKFIDDKRAAGLRVTRTMISNVANRMLVKATANQPAPTQPPTQHSSSSSSQTIPLPKGTRLVGRKFTREFMRRNNYSNRHSAKMTSALTANFLNHADEKDKTAKKAKRFLEELTAARIDNPEAIIINCDETNLQFESEDTGCIDKIGTKRPKIVSHALSSVISYDPRTKEYKRMPSLLVFKGTRGGGSMPLIEQPACLQPEDLCVGYAEKGFMTAELMTAYINKVVKPHVGEQKAIFTFDNASVHMKKSDDPSENPINAINDSDACISLHIIPEGMTSMLQPCDVGMFRSLKHRVRELTCLRFALAPDIHDHPASASSSSSSTESTTVSPSSTSSFVHEQLSRGEMRQLATDIVALALSTACTTELMRMSFTRSGITTELDGSNSNEVDISLGKEDLVDYRSILEAAWKHATNEEKTLAESCPRTHNYKKNQLHVNDNTEDREIHDYHIKNHATTMHDLQQDWLEHVSEQTPDATVRYLIEPDNPHHRTVIVYAEQQRRKKKKAEQRKKRKEEEDKDRPNWVNKSTEMTDSNSQTPIAGKKKRTRTKAAAGEKKTKKSKKSSKGNDDVEEEAEIEEEPSEEEEEEDEDEYEDEEDTDDSDEVWTLSESDDDNDEKDEDLEKKYNDEDDDSENEAEVKFEGDSGTSVATKGADSKNKEINESNQATTATTRTSHAPAPRESRSHIHGYNMRTHYKNVNRNDIYA